MPKYSPQLQDKYVLRMPDGLRDRIKKASDESGRSMNAEIVRVLQRAFPNPEPIRPSLVQLMELVEAYEDAVGPGPDRLPTKDLLDILHRVEIGQIDGLDPIVVKALEAKLDEFRSGT